MKIQFLLYSTTQDDSYIAFFYEKENCKIQLNVFQSELMEITLHNFVRKSFNLPIPCQKQKFIVISN